MLFFTFSAKLLHRYSQIISRPAQNSKCAQAEYKTDNKELKTIYFIIFKHYF
jgi:hypothetical protein